MPQKSEALRSPRSPATPARGHLIPGRRALMTAQATIRCLQPTPIDRPLLKPERIPGCRRVLRGCFDEDIGLHPPKEWSLHQIQDDSIQKVVIGETRHSDSSVA
jgi:hypothetical protein